MAAQPGVPPGWAEQVSMLLGQIRVAATAIHQQATGAPQRPAQPTEPKPTGKQGGAGNEAVGRRWLGPGGGIGGNKPAWGNQAGRSSEAASSTQVPHPTPPPQQKTPGQSGQQAATWKLAADAAAATDQERAVAAAARETAAAADAAAAAAANAAPNDRHDEKKDDEKNNEAGGGGEGESPTSKAEEMGSEEFDDLESIFADGEGEDDGSAMQLDRKEDETVQEHRRRIGRLAQERLQKRREGGRTGRSRKEAGRSNPY